MSFPISDQNLKKEERAALSSLKQTYENYLSFIKKRIEEIDKE
jgi:hypothetical protein